MNEKAIGREWFYSQGRLPFTECNTEGRFKVYRLAETKQNIYEYEIDSGLGGETVEIDQITDIHINYVGLEDEDDEEIQGTKKMRVWNKEAASVKSVIRAMDVAKYADQTVITGDTLDYLSKGAIMLMETHIINRDPGVIITLGGHELTKQMQTGLPNKLSMEERYAILKEHWPHDIFYYSKTVKGKVITAGLDNSRGQFPECIKEKLLADIEKARSEKKIILLFMHEPIATGTHVGEVPANMPLRGARSHFDFDGEEIIGAKPSDTEITREIYSVITENADVIKSVFCGHFHSLFSVDIKASYTDSEGRHDAVIPQFVASGNSFPDHRGVITRILVK